MEKTKILIVEDETIVALEIQDRLEKLGYEIVASVSTGEEALEKVDMYKPDLVLMDINLEGLMDGIEAAEIVLDRHAIPIIYLTAYSDDETLRRAKITEPFAYILKPFGTRELHTAIEIALYKNKIEKELEFHRDHIENLVDKRTSELKAVLRRQMEVSDKFTSCSRTLKSHTSFIAYLLGSIKDAGENSEALKAILNEQVVDNIEVKLREISDMFELLTKISRPGYVRDTEINLFEQIRNIVLLFTMDSKSSWIKIENRFPNDPAFLIKGVRLDLQSLMLFVLNLFRDEILTYYEAQSTAQEKDSVNASEPHIIIEGHAVDDIVIVRLSCLGLTIGDERKRSMLDMTYKISTSSGEMLQSSGREILGKMNGKVWLEDINDGGTSFSLQLPCMKTGKEAIL